MLRGLWITRVVLVCIAAGGLAAASAAVLVKARAPGSGETPYAVIAPEADSAEASMLADGVVTDEEYSQAVQNAVTCIRAAGLDARIAAGARPGIGVYGVTSPAEQEIIKNCVARHRDRVALAWLDQHRPSPATREQMLAEATACFISAGGSVGSGRLTAMDVNQILSVGDADQAQALGQCLQANEERYGFAF